MKKENAYDFQKRLLTVHEPNRRDPSRQPRENELALPEKVKISLSADAGLVTRTAAEDFADFLQVSMGISAQVVSDEPAFFQVALGEDLGEYATYKGFRIEVMQSGIRVFGHDERGIGQALYYMEDLMCFESAPVLPLGVICKKPLFLLR